MSDQYPVWWDFVSELEKSGRLLDKVRKLEAEIREIKSLNDPLNVRTRDRILVCERENAILHKTIAALRNS